MFKVLVSCALAAALLMPGPAAAQRPPPPTGVILFVGSSIFHRWTQLAAQMAPLPIVNRAFDGAQTADLLGAFGSLVPPYGPRVVVYYCGSNDIDNGEPAEAIADRIRQFVVRVGTAFPRTQTIFVSINRAPEKRDRWDVVDAVNERIRTFAAANPRVQYVDVNPLLFDHGRPRTELYMSDGLHLRPQAYEAFAGLLKPLLSAAFER